jgi:hypothetical protein
MENKNKLPGLDAPLDPAHLTGGTPASRPAGARPPARPADDEPAEDASSRQARAIVVSAAARLLRKEIAALERAAAKYAADLDGWAVYVTEFYSKHVALVADTLHVTESEAGSYCADQARQVLDGIAGMAAWADTTYAERVAEWALGLEAA